MKFQPGWRWLIVVAATYLLVLVPVSAEAQRAQKVAHIGYLSAGSQVAPYTGWLAAFREGLKKLGYVEGENVIVEPRYSEGKLERLPALADELVRANVDVLVTVPSGGAAAARRATSTIPIVFVGEPDPVGARLVDTLARPGRNVTGLADAHADLVPKRLQFLKEIAPSVSRVGVLWNPANASTRSQLGMAQAAAAALGLTVLPVDIKSPLRGDADPAFATIAKERLDGLLVVGDPTIGAQRKAILEHTLRHRLPAVSPHRSWVENGLLLSYGADFVDLSRRSAILVDKILKGAKPADLPVELPTQFELVINRKTAKALGLTIPPSLLLQAKIIE